ncbi:ribosomal protein S18-alanine N-acetyltransferase [Melissococcus plutonius]|uniref:Ribosomal-protein-S18p-alanine acetyltransferase n=1 Tax=Melissococcus plutonius TaxID=33970 RepID=A0A2Z5Y1W2_9ENTE|nr:ribosomal protein S18-alanine N-acetyltransferase [Melissococcus plutonius]BAL61934.1 ribosomal-protein-S18p-alanine acetyltransferase [Melissococcus plutonius DAT561]MCV2499364.1 ribosomal protein S18-alanine N-acetyltransferase [Melissococcus plutonius]MCV2500596.1 ribosomal protein S18-alanine N-acetyltransferase [Melissococcus plutonius]MCV2505042.1 ribosomal protein S18-alanine N-acetyltransferase [Melissococcus plutonius]MCV2507947.1 ribosomal protein S18-alanine N-acetyltransferase [
MWKKFNWLSNLSLFFTDQPFCIKDWVIIQDKKYFIHEITIKDIKVLLDIEREVYNGELPWTNSMFLSELHTLSPHLYLLISYKQEAVGFIGCRLAKKDLHVTNIAVKPAYQGRGIARYLIEEIKRYAYFHKCKTLSLEVRISNHSAQCLYRKTGFISKSIKQGYYVEKNEDALEMICYLEEGQK